MSWTEAWMLAKEQKQKHINFRVHGHLFAFDWIRTKFKCPWFSDSFFKSLRFVLQWTVYGRRHFATMETCHQPLHPTVLSKYIQHSQCKSEFVMTHWLGTKLPGGVIFQETEHCAVAQCTYTFISRYGKNKRTKKITKKKNNKLNTLGTRCGLATVYKL